MEWNDLLGKRYAVRWIFLIIALAIAILIFTRFVVLPHFSVPREPLGPFNDTLPNVGLAVIDAALSTLLTVGLTGAFIVLLVPRDVREAKIVTVHPRDLASELQASVTTSREYFFKGRSGRHFRSIILPLIESGSRASSATRLIWLLLPDPSDLRLMASYVQFRNAAAFRGRADDWTEWGIQREVLAALIALAAKARINPHLEIHIGLTKSFSIIRTNLTDTEAILTRDDPKLPAFKAMRGTVFYESQREDIQLSIRQVGELDLSSIWPHPMPFDAVSIGAALIALGFSNEASDPTKVDNVLQSVKSAINPYA